MSDDDDALVDDFEDDDELFDDELLEDDLFDDDDEDDDGLELDVAATVSFLPSSRVKRNAAIAMINTARTPTMIHFALLFVPPGGGTGGGPAGGPGGGAPGGGSVAEIGSVAGPWKSGCCSGGYHLPSDACHQPSPCPVSLMASDCKGNEVLDQAASF